MKKVATLIAAALVALAGSQAEAQCVGCAQSVSPTFTSVNVAVPMTYTVQTDCGCGAAVATPCETTSCCRTRRVRMRRCCAPARTTCCRTPRPRRSCCNTTCCGGDMGVPMEAAPVEATAEEAPPTPAPVSEGT